MYECLCARAPSKEVHTSLVVVYGITPIMILMIGDDRMHIPTAGGAFRAPTPLRAVDMEDDIQHQ